MPSQKPELPPLKTPKSFTFPSELGGSAPSLLSAVSIKREDGDDSESSLSSIATPSAYTEFLNTLTPVFTSPVAGGAFPKFTFEKAVPSPSSQPCSATSPAFSSGNSLISPVISLSPCSPVDVKSSKAPPQLRRLRIPQSLKAVSMKDSPLTATPLSATPRSASSMYSPFSPYDCKMRYLEAPRSAHPWSATPRSAVTKPVSVRQVVTRTITYKRTPLDPPPKGKRRKTHECKDNSKESCTEA